MAATQTRNRGKSAQARQQREAKASGDAKSAGRAKTYVVAPVEKDEFASFEVKASNKADADQKASEELAEKNVASAKFTVAPKGRRQRGNGTPRDPLAGMREVTEIPNDPQQRRNQGPSIWVARLKAVETSKTGKMLLKECSSRSTAHTAASSLRRKLKTGKLGDEIVAEHFRIDTSGTNVYASYIKPA